MQKCMKVTNNTENHVDQILNFTYLVDLRSQRYQMSDKSDIR